MPKEKNIFQFEGVVNYQEFHFIFIALPINRVYIISVAENPFQGASIIKENKTKQLIFVFS
jgi:hypothetical protein